MISSKPAASSLSRKLSVKSPPELDLLARDQARSPRRQVDCDVHVSSKFGAVLSPISGRFGS
jgi:hypothetical protein